MREIDETLAIQALHNEIEVYFEVGVKRNENLWSIKRDLEEKADFLYIIGVFTKAELNEEKEIINRFYRKSMARKKTPFVDLDVGF